jgi:hypothetical protein
MTQDQWTAVDRYLTDLFVASDPALAALAAHPRLTATAIQTVGSKGYDGLAIALVTGD